MTAFNQSGWYDALRWVQRITELERAFLAHPNVAISMLGASLVRLLSDCLRAEVAIDSLAENGLWQARRRLLKQQMRRRRRIWILSMVIAVVWLELEGS